ncbi:MAG TPA: hypothetical protein P5511_02250 [Candidatus Goldiibacteriota bacterium]|nr:hypothetical protein [Candidatus Goldiibacteriota bacterium]
MGIKQLIIIFLVIVFGASYLIGGSESISEKIEKYLDSNFKYDPENYEKYSYLNIVYMNLTAKYDRALQLIEKYEARFEKDEQKAKAQFQRASAYDRKLDGKRARAEYQKYVDLYPEGPNAKKARERINFLKFY